MNILEELKKRKKEQELLAHRLTKHIKSYKDLPEYGIKVMKKHKTHQYYIREKGGKYTYVPKSQINLVRDILQRDYEEKLLSSVLSNCKALDNMICSCGLIKSVNEDYDQLSEGRRDMIDPIILTDEKYVELWNKKYPGGKNSFYGEGQYVTDRGENVRSKSEKILADLFYKRGIPYQYEPEILMKDGSIVYPDFILLNVPQRKTFIWEHFGLISDDGYAANNMRKICRYERNDIGVEMGLIITSESDGIPLKMSDINEKIDRFLL